MAASNFSGVQAQAWGRGLPFLRNLQDPADATGWGSVNYSNQGWGVSMFNANRITNVALGTYVNTCSDTSMQSPVNPRAATCHIRDYFLRLRRQECLWRRYNWHNPLANPRVHFWDNNREGPVTQ